MRQIGASEDPERATGEMEAKTRSLSSPSPTAEALTVEDIINPRETRQRLCAFIETSHSYLQTELGPKTKYGARPTAGCLDLDYKGGFHAIAP